MNYTEVNQTGGFPLETDTLQALQSAYSIFNALGELAGNYAIISGCTTSGSMVSDGVVYINGEVLNFKGSTKGTYVIIKEDTSERVFEDGQSKIVYKNRYATFGSSTTKYAWVAFKPIKNVLTLDAEKESKAVVNELKDRVTSAENTITTKASKEEVDELSKKIMPIGGIIMWSGSTTNIPKGWFLCNGSNGTPDLRNRFVVGAGSSYNVGNTGGSNTVTLTEAQMPRHNHTGTTNAAGGHSHSFQLRQDVYGTGSGAGLQRDTEGNDEGYRKFYTSYEPHHSHTFTTITKGSSQAHENRPPYYALAYIMFKG